MVENSDIQQIRDLIIEVNKLAAQAGLTAVQTEQIDPWKDEAERMEKYLSEFSVRQGILLSVAGLLSSLPIATVFPINYFLIWMFPFLAVAIICYIFSSKRINFVSRESPTHIDSWQLNTVTKDVYFKSMFFHRCCDVFLVSFFVSLTLHSYFLAFSESLTQKELVLVTILSLCFGVARLWYVTKVQKYPPEYFHGVGGEG